MSEFSLVENKKMQSYDTSSEPYSGAQHVSCRSGDKLSAIHHQPMEQLGRDGIGGRHGQVRLAVPPGLDTRAIDPNGYSAHSNMSSGNTQRAQPEVPKHGNDSRRSAFTAASNKQLPLGMQPAVDMKSLTGALINAAEGTGEVEHILKTAKFCPRLPGLTKLIGVLSKQHGAWRKALEVYQCVTMLDLVPDTALTNAAISACDRGGQWEAALQLWVNMDHRDNISYSAMISALAKGKQWTLALEVFCFMMRAGCWPDVITCCSLIAALDKGNYWQLAERVFLLLWTERLPEVDGLLQHCNSQQNVLPCNFVNLKALWAPSTSPGRKGVHSEAHRVSLWEWCISAEGLESPNYLRAVPDDLSNGYTSSAARADSTWQQLGSSCGGSADALDLLAGGDSSASDMRADKSDMKKHAASESSLLNIWAPTHTEHQNFGPFNMHGSPTSLSSAATAAVSIMTSSTSGFSPAPPSSAGTMSGLSSPFSTTSADRSCTSPEQQLANMLAALGLDEAGSTCEPQNSFFNLPEGQDKFSVNRNSFKYINTICCNALLSAYANASPPQWERSLLLLSAMHHNHARIGADCVAYNTVMKACRAANRINVAYRVFGFMLEAGVTPSIATFNTMISAALSKQHYDMTAHLWDKMVAARIQPSVACANAAIIALEHLGRWEDALRIFHAMLTDPKVRHGGHGTQAMPPPTTSTFNSIMAGHIKRGAPQKAIHYFQIMQSMAIAPSPVTLNLLSTALGALDLLTSQQQQQSRGSWDSSFQPCHQYHLP